jgi:hypothetical protein
VADLMTALEIGRRTPDFVFRVIGLVDLPDAVGDPP